MRIILTGGSGFIGGWFAASCGAEVECVVLGRASGRKELSLRGRTCSYVPTDYSRDDLASHLGGCDALVHLAAQRYEAKLRMDDYVDNIMVAAHLYEACATVGVTNIAHLSTIGVYSPGQPLPWSEEQSPTPMTLYGVSKLAVEKLGEYYSRKHSLCVKNLRVAQVVGVGERGGFMLAEFIKRASAKECLNVFGEGEGARDYIYVKDVVSAIVRALKAPALKGTFNVGSGKLVSHRTLAETINKVYDNAGNVSFNRERAEDKTQCLMDTRRTTDVLGWVPTWSLEDALRDMWSITHSQAR